MEIIDLVVCAGACDLQTLVILIDASFATSEETHCHIGEHLSLGACLVSLKLSKEQLNINNAIITELVGISEYLSTVLRNYLFMGAQRNPMKDIRTLQEEVL